MLRVAPGLSIAIHEWGGPAGAGPPCLRQLLDGLWERLGEVRIGADEGEKPELPAENPNPRANQQDHAAGNGRIHANSPTS